MPDTGIMAHHRMKFGVFMAPFHRIGENPTLALDRDLELIQWLDVLGYDEAYFGEYHSAGWETIASPEIFIATAAERTRHIGHSCCRQHKCRNRWLGGSNGNPIGASSAVLIRHGDGLRLFVERAVSFEKSDAVIPNGEYDNLI